MLGWCSTNHYVAILAKCNNPHRNFDSKEQTCSSIVLWQSQLLNPSLARQTVRQCKSKCEWNRVYNYYCHAVPYLSLLNMTILYTCSQIRPEGTSLLFAFTLQTVKPKSCAHEYNYVVRLPIQPVKIIIFMFIAFFLFTLCKINASSCTCRILISELERQLIFGESPGLRSRLHVGLHTQGCDQSDV